ncbi:MAG TPA: hypothetical protein VLJ37_00785 [bacterium]|nr:hypothetical protein [bacterium]
MAPGAEGVGGGRSGEFDPTRGHEGRFGERNERADAITRDLSRPGAEAVGGERGNEGLPDEVQKLDAEYEAAGFGKDPARSGGTGERGGTGGPVDSYGDAPARNVPWRTGGTHWEKAFRWVRVKGTHVMDVVARRASVNAQVGYVQPRPMERIRLLDDKAPEVSVPLGEANIVSIDTVKQRVAAIENRVPWSEGEGAARSRKAAQLEPDLTKKYKEEYQKSVEAEYFKKMLGKDAYEAALGEGKVEVRAMERLRDQLVKQGRSKPEAEKIAKLAIRRKKVEISAEAQSRAKRDARVDARNQATNWYKDAALERRQWVDARAKELLPEMQRKHPHDRDMAKYRAERQAKAEWDQKIKDAKKDLPVIVDTNIPGMGYDYMRVIDHHGPFLKRADGSMQKANATMQMMNRFEDALRAAGAKDVNNPTDAQVREAMRLMNIKEVATDNLADGAWSVWMAEHQAEVLRNPELRGLIREATYFEDFTAFSQGKYDRNDPAVELQASLFSEYGKILAQHGIKGSDRIPPDKAEAIMTETMTAMDKMISDPVSRAKAAETFWTNVDAARAKAEDPANGVVIHEAQVDGKTVMKFYDMTKLSEFTVFEQWLAVPDIYRERPQTNPDGSLKHDDNGHPIMGTGESLSVQVTVAPVFRPKMKADGTPEYKTKADGTPEIGPDGKPVAAMELDPNRSLPIVAIPFGNRVGGKQGLLVVLDALNKAERAKAEAAGVEPNFWFGKDSVVLPNPAGGGSRLSTTEIADIITDPKYGLFKKGTEPVVDGTGDHLATLDGKQIGPLNPRYVHDVHGFAAKQAYTEASKLIDQYGVKRDSTPRAKGERLAVLAERGDVRAREALDLLYEMKGEGNTLVDLSDRPGSGEQWLGIPTANLKAKAARFKSLVAELGPALEGRGAVDAAKWPAIRERAGQARDEYNNHRQFTDSTVPTGTQVDAYVFADAWAVQGNAKQREAAQGVIAAAESNQRILEKKRRTNGEMMNDIEVLEKARESGDANLREEADRALGEIYGVVDRNMQIIDRWRNYAAERKKFDAAIAVFETPYISSALARSAHLYLGLEAPADMAVLDVTSKSPELYEDLGSIGKTPGDYAVTIWVKTAADGQRILGDIWSKQNANNVKWGRDGDNRYLRIVDGEGREFQVHVAVPKEAASGTGTAAKPSPKPDAAPYDMAAKRASNGSSTDVTAPGGN